MKRILVFLMAVIAACILNIPQGGSFAEAVAASVPVDYSGCLYASMDYTMVVLKDGTLWGWGWDKGLHFGMRDNGESPNSNIVQKPGKIMDNVKMVSAGRNHTLVVKNDGSLWGWGGNMPNEREQRLREFLKPTKLMDGVKQAACGAWFSMALKNDGTLWGWGMNTYLEISDEPIRGTASSSLPSYTPVYFKPIKVLDNVKAISAPGSGETVFALMNDGNLWTWGKDCRGKYDAKMKKCLISKDVKALFTGDSSYNDVLFIKKDDTLWGWGSSISKTFLPNYIGDRYEKTDIPVKFMDNVKTAALDSSCIYAVKMDGTLLGWGWIGDDDELKGLARYKSKVAPKDPGAYIVMTDVEAVSTDGPSHTLAMKKDGSVWGWGGSNRIDLGDYFSNHIKKPARIEFSSEPNLLFQGEDSPNSDYLSDYMKDPDAEWNSPEFASSGKASNWSGLWVTNGPFAEVLYITQKGSTITARDRLDMLVFAATVSGNRLKGRFADDSRGLGIFEIVMSKDGKSFKGLRFQDSLDKPAEWTGEKNK